MDGIQHAKKTIINKTMKKTLLKIVIAVSAIIIALIAIVGVNALVEERYYTECHRGVELIEEGKLEEGLTYFEAKLKEHPKNPYAHFQISTVYCDLKMYDSAMVYMDNAFKYMPKRHQELRGLMHAIKATIHSHLNEFEEAIEQLSLCLSVLPNDEALNKDRIVAYRQRAEIYYYLKQYELAEQDFKKAEELESLSKTE